MLKEDNPNSVTFTAGFETHSNYWSDECRFNVDEKTVFLTDFETRLVHC